MTQAYSDPTRRSRRLRFRTMSHAAACANLPSDAEISETFGNPGEGGYVAYYKTPQGDRWRISNGEYYAPQPFDWVCSVEHQYYKRCHK